jgi:hypothetical protein
VNTACCFEMHLSTTSGPKSPRLGMSDRLNDMIVIEEQQEIDIVSGVDTLVLPNRVHNAGRRLDLTARRVWTTTQNLFHTNVV